MRKSVLSRILAVVLLIGLFVGIAQPAEAASKLTSSDELIEVIKKMEGFSKKPYWDYRHWAVGYGTRCPDDKLKEYKKDGITKSAAEKLLKKELGSTEAAVNDFATTYKLKLKQHQFDALVSFSYNCGPGWMSDTSGYFNTAVREKDKSNAFLYGICLWSSAGGEYILIKRRMCEANMYINGEYKASNSGEKDLYPDNFRWVFLDGNGGEPEYKIYAFDSDKPLPVKVDFDSKPTGKDKEGKKFTYKLAGWYTEDGIRVTQLDDSLKSGEVIYAKWKDSDGNIVEIPKGKPPEAERVVVTGSDVNVRSGPGTYYAKKTTAKKGTVLVLTEVYEANGSLWGKFKDGWIYLDYTSYDEAASITQQPTSKVADEGSEIKVSVEAVGAGLQYQWYYKDKGDDKYRLDKTATTDTYSITMTEDCAGRKVYCVVKDKYKNEIKSEKATLGLKVRIDKQPKSVNVKKGKRVNLTVEATGEDLTYQWYYKNKGDSKYTLATSMTGSTYSVKMSDSCTGRKIYCVITDQYGNEVKTNTVTVGMAASVEKQPVSVAVKKGEKATLNLTATGDELTYKWYYKDAGSSKFKACSGTGKATYSITMTESRSGRQMYCVVTDQYGNEVKSNVVTIAIKTKITKQPKSVEVTNGKTVKVSVSAIGDGLTYKWYKKDVGDSKYTRDKSATGDTYSVEMSSSVSGRRVFCRVTDAHGNMVQSKSATLGMEVSISKQPKSVEAANGKKAKVTVTATGDDLTYKWYIKDVGDSKYTRVKTVTGKTYSAKMSSRVSGRKVYCKITDAYGNTVKTKKVTLGMEVSISKQPKSATAENGKKVTLKVAATGDGLTYKWYYKSAGSKKFKACSGTGKSTYSITMKESRAGRQMYCVITDKYGNEIKTETVTVGMQVSLEKQPVSKTVKKGKTAKVSVSATGEGLTYKWYSKDKGESKYTRDKSADGDTYKVKMSSKISGRKVFCKITDQYGNQVKTNKVTLKMK